MKNIQKIFYLLIAAVSLTACEKVVVLDIDEEEPVLVINAQISNEFERWSVNLSTTQGYFDQNDISYVSAAEVTITDGDGKSDTLQYDKDGVFLSKSIKQCEVGQSYTLEVKYKGETYYATETCFYQDTIDFIRSYYLPDQNGFIPAGYYVFEKAGEYEPDGDFYLWRLFKNGADLKDSIGYLYDTDEFREVGFWNLEIDPDNPLKDIDKGVYPRPFPIDFEKGDTARVEQLRISEGYFDFIVAFSSQQQRSGTPFDPPPANPPTNIQGGAYGYFSVVNKSVKEVIVTD